ncbi:MAG: YraN family protein [Clostridium sp.]|uniref:YraN family protein n=1 Tax=Clostridium sp. DSM 8431 TaxID=1761781 RepID=UPI0008EF5C73|nr:YraN family protein [Clostridium sp. DSM 8431]MCR4944176.1 YraN family protein [Clostridium sp.]SFU36656.1 putative endonuclease [Clostridium sp. DSM 8431]
MKKENKNIGNYGENLACDFLSKKNHLILKRNFRNAHGEIDIISKIDNIIVFTEVKSRYSLDFGHPCEAITFSKIRTIKNTASYYLYINKIRNINIRFDVIEITLNYYNNKYKINHTENAF